jgi:hypothetical protein
VKGHAAALEETAVFGIQNIEIAFVVTHIETAVYQRKLPKNTPRISSKSQTNLPVCLLMA